MREFKLIQRRYILLHQLLSYKCTLNKNYGKKVCTLNTKNTTCNTNRGVMRFSLLDFGEVTNPSDKKKIKRLSDNVLIKISLI